MVKNKWKRNETKRKRADTLINLGEKFFYAGYITPLVIFIKYGFTFKVIIFATSALGIFSFMGLALLEKRWKEYDKLKD